MKGRGMKYDDFGPTRLQVRFGVDKPVELVQLTLALMAMGRDYRQYANDTLRDMGYEVGDDDTKLYVTSMRDGSIVAELGSAAQLLGAFMPLVHAPALFTGYVQFFGQSVDYYATLAKRKDPKASDINSTKAAAQVVSDILAVVTASPKTNLHLAAKVQSKNGAGEEFLAEVTISNEQAVLANRGALMAQRLLEQRVASDYSNVLLHFQQTSTEMARTDGRTPDRAIIPSISPRALPVHFASQLDAALINSMKADPRQNPFTSGFRVNVNVEADRHGIPRYYRVTNIHEVIPDDVEDQETL